MTGNGRVAFVRPRMYFPAMRAWILSDLHIEQSNWDMPESRPDFDVLIAAGDIHDPLSEGVRWLAERSGGRPVIYVPGNHEWYAHRKRFTVRDESARAQELAEELGIHLLQDSEVIIDGVRFLGSTLWTDFEIFGNGRMAMRNAGRWMNDFRVIFPTDQREALSPEQTLRWHMKSRFWIEEALREPFDGKIIVVTHHLPHPRSVHPQYANDPVTPAFCSDLSELVENSGATLWVHGHTHTSCDYMAGETRVVCNPKGYGPQARSKVIENDEFKPELVIEI
jgi:Icc-related predicted phosphoesterase